MEQVIALFIVLAIGIGSALYLLRRDHRRKLLATRSNPSFKKRRSDNEALSHLDQVDYLQAERFKKEGNFQAAAKLLEKIGMHREAIDILEHSQSYQAAANILLRLGRPYRAGVLLERNKKWKEAIECYRMTASEDEIRRCVEASCKTAGIEDSELIEAAVSHANQDFLSAARLFRKGQRKEEAWENYLLAAESGKGTSESFDREDLEFLTAQMHSHKLNEALLLLLRANPMLRPLLVSFLNKGQLRSAQMLLKLIYPQNFEALVHDTELSGEGLLNLADILLQLSEFAGAAAALAKNDKWQDAGRVAEVGELHALAAEYFQKAGMDRKASEMRLLAAERPGEAAKSGLLDIILRNKA